MNNRWQDTLPKPIAFVLSAGASLGAVQVGMLKALLDADLHPDIIVGASIGALNGAIIANWGLEKGVNLLMTLWSEIEKEDIFPGGKLSQAKHFLRKRTSLFPNDSLIELGYRALPAHEFDQLSTPFGALATELMTYRGALFTKGDLYKALLASAAMPGIFPPVDINGRLYVDGALTAYVPLSAAVQLGAASLVVLDVGEACQRETPPRHVAEMVTWSMHAALRQRALVEAPALSQKMPILYLPSPCNISKGLLDFSGIARRIEDSYQLAQAFLAYVPSPQPGSIIGSPHHHANMERPGFMQLAEA